MDDSIECSFYDVPCHVNELLVGFNQLLLRFYASLLDGLAVVMESVPAPDFLNRSPVTLPDSVGFWLDLAEFQTGLGIIVSAYILRFLIRRIPVIG